MEPAASDAHPELPSSPATLAFLPELQQQIPSLKSQHSMHQTTFLPVAHQAPTLPVSQPPLFPCDQHHLLAHYLHHLFQRKKMIRTSRRKADDKQLLAMACMDPEGTRTQVQDHTKSKSQPILLHTLLHSPFASKYQSMSPASDHNIMPRSHIFNFYPFNAFLVFLMCRLLDEPLTWGNWIWVLSALQIQQDWQSCGVESGVVRRRKLFMTFMT
jgi:hypothetical protein